MSFNRNMGKNIGKNIIKCLNRICSQKLLDHAKTFVTYALKTTSKQLI